MDIRQYVHIKKVPGGHQGDCYLVHGAICTKHVANKKVLIVSFISIPCCSDFIKGQKCTSFNLSTFSVNPCDIYAGPYGRAEGYLNFPLNMDPG